MFAYIVRRLLYAIPILIGDKLRVIKIVPPKLFFVHTPSSTGKTPNDLPRSAINGDQFSRTTSNESFGNTIAGDIQEDG